MARPLNRLLVVLSDSEDLQRNLLTVVTHPFVMQRVPDWKALRRVLGAAPHTAVCFVDALAKVGSDIALVEDLREITREFPLVSVIACLSVAGGGREVLTTLQDWGVSEIIDLDRDKSPQVVAHRLNQVKGIWAQRLIRYALPRTLTARGRALLEAAAEVTSRGGSVKELGDILGVSRNTITRWCEKAGVPEPRRMFSWIRLLLAAHALEDRHRSIESVARMAGFASAGSLKSASVSYAGLPPSELRHQGAFATVARLAQLEFREARERSRQSKTHNNSWYN